jgi:nitrite reductase (NADH) small subunit
MATATATMTTTTTTTTTTDLASATVEDAMWTAVCKYTELEPGRGVAALVDGHVVALFRLGDGSLHAVGNTDPFSGASVISRGITGMRSDGTATVASPMYKDVFDLATGVALDTPDVRLPVYAVRRHRGMVWIGPDVTSGSAPDAELLTMATSAA